MGERAASDGFIERSRVQERSCGHLAGTIRLRRTPSPPDVFSVPPASCRRKWKRSHKNQPTTGRSASRPCPASGTLAAGYTHTLPQGGRGVFVRWAKHGRNEYSSDADIAARCPARCPYHGKHIRPSEASEVQRRSFRGRRAWDGIAASTAADVYSLTGNT